jgi:hypothetical protein
MCIFFKLRFYLTTSNIVPKLVAGYNIGNDILNKLYLDKLLIANSQKIVVLDMQ